MFFIFFPEIVKLLVKAGVNMKKTDRFGKSPLLLACHTPNLPTIEFLLENGCDPFCRDNNMNSCIQQICQVGCLQYWNQKLIIRHKSVIYIPT